MHGCWRQKKVLTPHGPVVVKWPRDGRTMSIEEREALARNSSENVDREIWQGTSFARSGSPQPLNRVSWSDAIIAREQLRKQRENSPTPEAETSSTPEAETTSTPEPEPSSAPDSEAVDVSEVKATAVTEPGPAGATEPGPKIPTEPKADRDRRSRSRSRRRYDDRERNRSRSPDSRERYHDRRERRDRSPPPANGNHFEGERSTRPPERNFERKDQMMKNVNETSQQDRRVYVGNLSYDVKWHHLKDHMRKDGTLDVLFADVLLLPNGMSKGCGIVEYATRDQAQEAISALSNTPLMGRLVYVREDRETEPRFSGQTPARGGGGGFGGGFGGRGGAAGPGGGYGAGGGMGMGGGGMGGGGRQIFVSNVGWQDLKDLFRQAGNVIRADVHLAPDGNPKGSGIVAFESPEDAQNAIQNFNGYDWQGRMLEVREDRYANSGPGFRGGFGGGRGGFGGGFGGRGAYAGGGGAYGGGGGYGGGFGGRGGFGGGGGYAGGRGGYGGGRGGYDGGGGGYSGGGGSQSGYAGGGGAAAPVVPPNAFTDGVNSGGEPNGIIHVKNLPWSTSNEDLVELFQTIGTVDRAEIQYEPNGRSRGSGVVQFGSQTDAATAIEKFQGYSYGGRPLGLDYARYPDGGAMEGQETTASMQEQMM